MPPRSLPRRFVPSFTAARGLWTFWVILALLLGPALPGARGDIQQPNRSRSAGERRLQRQNGPAVALPQDTAVEQGGRVDILLRGEGQGGRMLDFLIRSQPKHGTLSVEPIQVSRNLASITYFQSPGDDATDDEFTFAVQAYGSAVSAPQTVRVRILPSEPILEMSPPELDFGAVKAGETSQAEFTLSNRGGSLADGRVAPPPPWMVDGPSDYHLPRGGSQTFRLVFKPTGEEVFTDEMHFRYEARGGVRLVGTGLADPAQQAALAARAAAVKAANAAADSQAAPPAGTATGIDVNGARVASGGRPTTANPGGLPGQAGAGAGGGAPGQTSSLPGGGLGSGRAPIASATPATSANRGSGGRESASSGDLSTANPDDTSVILNEASVEEVQLQDAGTTTVDLAWMPPVPKPGSYRVELRYLSMDGDKLRIDWRPYPSVKFNIGRDKVTAHLSGLPSGGLQMMRVVAVDTAGRLAAPSPMITAPMKMAPGWTHYVTPLNVLLAALLVCGVLLIRKKLENRAILREIDDSRARIKEAEESMAWRP